MNAKAAILVKIAKSVSAAASNAMMGAKVMAFATPARRALPA